jgi:hypothetical protein
MAATCDLFLTHAWRYHDDWLRMVELLNAQGVRSWRNFSLPWYDPALDPRTPDGGKVVRWGLETQIIPCHAVVLLAGVYQQLGCRTWVETEVEMARRHHKTIIAVPPRGTDTVPPEVLTLADTAAPWHGAAIMTLARAAGARHGVSALPEQP